MIVTDHIRPILLVTGAFTVGPLVAFLFPVFGFKAMFKLAFPSGASGLFARHWGLLIASFGALLIAAAWDPALRRPVMLVAGLEKLALASLVLADWKRPHSAGLRPVAIVDAASVLVYALYLLKLA